RDVGTGSGPDSIGHGLTFAPGITKRPPALCLVDLAREPPGICAVVLATRCGRAPRPRHTRLAHVGSVSVSSDDHDVRDEERDRTNPLVANVPGLLVPRVQHEYGIFTNGHSCVGPLG